MKLFEYFRADQAVNLESFIEAEAGCLLVPRTQLRGVESHSILHFAKTVENAGRASLRCSTDIILCFPENSVDVYNMGPGIRQIEGLREDLAPFKKLNKMLDMYNIKHVVFLEEDFSSTEVQLCKEEMKQSRFQISYKDDVPSSPDDLYKQLDGLQEGGVIVYTQTREEQYDQLRIWSQGRNISVTLAWQSSIFIDILNLF